MSPTIDHGQNAATTDRPYVSLWRYVGNARLGVVLSAPLLYICIVPFLFLDLFISVYQAVCFPVYKIPKVARREFFIFDRGRLRYLNLLERLNCIYCSYSNGLIAYVGEIGARTEQHWCPIKHERDQSSTHARYRKFLTYGDAEGYRAHSEVVRREFGDLAEPHDPDA